MGLVVIVLSGMDFIAVGRAGIVGSFGLEEFFELLLRLQGLEQ